MIDHNNISNKKYLTIYDISYILGVSPSIVRREMKIFYDKINNKESVTYNFLSDAVVISENKTTKKYDVLTLNKKYLEVFCKHAQLGEKTIIQEENRILSTSDLKTLLHSDIRVVNNLLKKITENMNNKKSNAYYLPKDLIFTRGKMKYLNARYLDIDGIKGAGSKGLEAYLNILAETNKKLSVSNNNSEKNINDSYTTKVENINSQKVLEELIEETNNMVKNSTSYTKCLFTLLLKECIEYEEKIDKERKNFHNKILNILENNINEKEK